ncbi:VLTF-2 [Sea otter poxvirus]|uniref:Viral late gene transcription factor 2 n=1 Tax=Sea otter poxvirus TaxID=1416741 RepID=A0A2U9QHQ9_9POXV|nr:VLTF-2 [Sea otter poxvirus]AWU47134.1 VLTF-2 [Sea otter poxvirus]
MAKRISLPTVTISTPKSAIRTTIQDSIGSVLPLYYRIINNDKLDVSSCGNICWFCHQYLTSTSLTIETLLGGDIGVFCSHICKDSFACMIKAHVALREEPRIAILPLVCYKDPNKVISIINSLRSRDDIYGNCFFDEKNKTIQMSLRSLDL